MANVIRVVWCAAVLGAAIPTIADAQQSADAPPTAPTDRANGVNPTVPELGPAPRGPKAKAVPEFDPATAGAIGTLLAGAAALVARRAR